MNKFITAPKDIAPLVTFRILFGLLMAVGAIRFIANGWIERLYIEPQFFFKFYGFAWVEPLGVTGMYAVFSVIVLSALGIAFGCFYRLSTIVFFVLFTYVELIDATNYLNHYYLVCLFAFILMFLPAHRAFSIDVWRKPKLRVNYVPAWTIHILVLQLTIVYTCAGIAKLNADWIFKALPLSIWLPEHKSLPIIGTLFSYKWIAFLFSWGGAFYDLTIAYFLMYAPTRKIAYMLVVLFHLMTYLLFNIGLFPFIMIFSTLIFFPAQTHKKWLSYFGYHNDNNVTFAFSTYWTTVMRPLFICYIILQLFLPFRHWLYEGNVLWNEQGYRFSWRVMLVEKIGQVTFYVEDKEQKRKTEIINGRYLTQFQEKQMSIQPDFMLQFAQFLKNEFQVVHGMKNPIITVDAHVALNGRISKRFVDADLNLGDGEIVVLDFSKPYK